MPPPLSINIIYNKTNTYGLKDDVEVIERILRKLQDSIGHPISKPRLVDMREPLIHSDINIHLEIPIFAAIPWAHTNIMLVNPEQWSYAYDSYVHAFDALIFRDPVSAIKFRAAFIEKGISTDNFYVVPWCASWQQSNYKGQYSTSADDGFVSFVAGSTSKYEYLKQVLPYWLPTDPTLTVYTTRQDFADGLYDLAENVTVKCQDLSLEEQRSISSLHSGHLICSQGEAFGYAAANAEVCGAFSIMNFLPTFEHFYDNPTGISWLANSYVESTKVRYSTAKPTATIREELDAAFNAFRTCDFSEICKIR